VIEDGDCTEKQAA